VELMMVGGFITMFSYPLFIGCHQALWLSKVAPDAQGRVLATRRMLTGLVVPLAFLAAGPLADGLFEPLLQEGGLLAGSVGRVLGVGPGRGIGLLFLCMGGLGLVAAALIRLVRPIWRVESLLADWSAG
jgi:MFS transporter, DHA3 family, macrolide efflux protein